MELKEKIFNTGCKLFMTYGIRSVSMDDIARELSISKKTLYTEYRDKNAIVENVVMYQLQELDSQIDAIMASDANPVQQIFKIANVVIETRKSENPNVMYDLKKYHPTVFEKLCCHKDENSMKMVQRNLKRGQELGFYREEMDVDIIGRIFMNTMFELFNPIEFPIGDKDVETIFRQYLSYHVRGIINENGLIEYKKWIW
jgi:TetR/AcrR family transcriptional regulator, cholesterol catabolism regulator